MSTPRTKRIFEPVPDPIVDAEISGQSSEYILPRTFVPPQLVSRMIEFYHRVNLEDLVGLSPNVEDKVQYKGSSGFSKKSKSSGFSHEASLVETWIDFRTAIEEQKFYSAVPLYNRLRKYLGGDPEQMTYD